MKKLLLLFGLCAMQTPQAQDLHKNVAYADNHVRFTVISDGAVRMEYAPDGQFVDAKSFVAVQRAYPAAGLPREAGRVDRNRHAEDGPALQEEFRSVHGLEPLGALPEESRRALRLETGHAAER